MEIKLLGPQSLILQEIRQDKAQYPIDEFVLEFLLVWDFIHRWAPDLTLFDLKNFVESIRDTIGLPFYEKFQNLEIIELNEGG